MKKSIIALSFLALTSGVFAQTEKKAELSTVLDFTYANEYVYRGVNRADDNYQFGVKLDYGTETSKVYLGIWQMLPDNSDHRKETQFDLWQNNAYIGYYGAVSDYLAFDAGFINYLYPRDSIVNDSQEFYLGAILSLPQVKSLKLSTYGYYNIALDAFTIEPSIAYTIDFGTIENVIPLWLDLSAYYGIYQGKDFVYDEHREFYTYSGAAANLVTRIADHVFLSVGVNYGTNYQRLDGHETNNNTWWNAKIAFAY